MSYRLPCLLMLLIRQKSLTPDLDSDSVTVAPAVLQTQNAGMYICSATVSDNHVAGITEFNISKTYTLNISSE